MFKFTFLLVTNFACMVSSAPNGKSKYKLTYLLKSFKSISKIIFGFSLGGILEDIGSLGVETINTISGSETPFCLSADTCKFYQQCQAARCELDQGLALCFIIGLVIFGIIALTACCLSVKEIRSRK